MTAAMRAVRSEATALAAALVHQPGEQASAPTRCGDWTVHVLLGHLVDTLERAVSTIRAAGDFARDNDRLSYYRSPLRYDPGRDVSRQAATRASAARFETPAAAIVAMLATVEEIDVVSAAADGSTVRTYWGPSLQVEDFLVTRSVELAVHGLDLADALSIPPWLTIEAAGVVAGLLRDLLGTDLPAAMGWDAERLIRVGTGRAAATPDEAAILGDMADRFPLLS